MAEQPTGNTIPPESSPSGNKNVIITIIVIAVLLIGAFVLLSRNTEAPVTEPETAIEEETIGNPAGIVEEGINNDLGSPNSAADDSDAMTEGQIKEFTVTGRNFEFSPAEIRVNEGDTVRVTFVNEQGTHDWRLDEFNAATAVIQTGQQETVEFVADQAGEFEYYCSVGQHRQMGMVGTLIVE